MWDALKCDLCGICLERCPFGDFTREQAAEQIKLLMEGKEAGILKRCVTCCACTEFCPTKADPFDLILAMLERTGSFPVNPAMVAVFDQFSGIPSSVTSGDPDKPALSLCIMEGQIPLGTLDSELFRGLTIAKGGAYFCSIGYIHLGRISPLQKNARPFVDALVGLGREIIFFHDDCYAMVHAKIRDFGLTVPFAYRHLFEYLRDYLRDHRSRITRLDMAVAYQRPCASRYTPEKDVFLDEIFSLIGVHRVPRNYDRENALCCSAAFVRVYPDLAQATQARNIDDALESGAQALVTLCPMCDRLLKRPTEARGFPKIYITDLCRMALGELPISL